MGTSMNETWNNYKALILSAIETNSEKLEKLAEDINEIKVEISVLKSNASMWGAVAGFIISTIITIIASVLGILI